MNEEYLKKTWMAVIAHAAPLGPQAIKDQMLMAHCGNAHVSSVDVVDLGDYAYKVKVGFTQMPTRELRTVEIAVRNPNVSFGRYEDAVRYIHNRQKEMPPHLAGREHNVDEFMATKILDFVRRKTGYPYLAHGDIWVHSCSTLEEAQAAVVRQEGAHCGMVSFGHITRAGEIAMRKFIEVEFGPDAEPVYAKVG